MTRKEIIKALRCCGGNGGCTPCPCYHADMSLTSNCLEMYIKAAGLLEAQEQEEKNEPLTLEELRQMGGEPYWHVGLRAESSAPHWVVLEPHIAKCPEDYGYGKHWLAYRRKTTN